MPSTSVHQSMISKNTLSIAATQYTHRSVSFAVLLLRLGTGLLMIPHGYSKWTHFSERQDTFMNFLGLGSTVSLSLVIFAELICSILLTIGLFTRIVTFPLLITALVIVFVAHEGDILGDASSGFFFLLSYLTILLIGPGDFSLDHVLFGKAIAGTALHA